MYFLFNHYRNMTPEDCAKDSTFCCKLEDGKLSLKCEHNYFHQVMGQMAITERNWCDFVVYTKKSISVQRIMFSEEWKQNILPKLRDFYQTAFVAELFTQRVKRGLPLFK